MSLKPKDSNGAERLIKIRNHSLGGDGFMSH